jgi:hypothetical protein
MRVAKQPKSSAQKILFLGLGILAVALVLFAGFALNKYRVQRNRERGYEQVNIGDSKELVSSLMGQPDELQTCRVVSGSNDSADDREYQRNCFDQYWYYSLLHPYVISFNKDGRVIAKAYQISP